MAGYRSPDRVPCRYGTWPGGALACWAYAPGLIDAIMVADDEGRVTGRFVRYVHYAAPEGRR